MRKFFKGLFRLLFLLIISTLVGTNIYIINAKMLGDQLPMPFGYGAAIVLTGSMRPDLYEDDLVIVHDSKDYEVGEWVVYQDGGILVVHEVISTDGENFQTQGKANNSPDAPIKIEQIRGEVIFTIPKAGPVIRYLQSPMGILVVLLAGFIGLEISYIIERVRYNNSMNSLEKERKSLLRK